MQEKDAQRNEEQGMRRRSRLLWVAVPGGILLLVIILCFCLTSCGQGDAPADNEESKQTEIVLGDGLETSASVESSEEVESPTSAELSAAVESSVSTEASADEAAGQVQATDQEPIDPYMSLNFYDVEEEVTAKEATNLRDVPSQGEESTVMAVLQNGEVAQRIALSDGGWSKVRYKGEEYYAVSSLLTTDLDYHVEEEVDDGIRTVFTPCEDKVSPKIEVNLRRLPSVTHEDATIVVTLPYGEVVTRTGINTDVGWSRVEYNGEVLYCISSYVYVVE